MLINLNAPVRLYLWCHFNTSSYLQCCSLYNTQAGNGSIMKLINTAAHVSVIY